MLHWLCDSYGWIPSAGFARRVLWLALFAYLVLTWLPASLPLIEASGAAAGSAVAGGSLKLLQRSLWLAAVSATFALVPGVCVGVSLWWRRGIVWDLRWLLFAFLFLPPFLLVQGWMAFSQVSGWFLPPSGFWWAVVIMGMAFAPLIALIVASARQAIECPALQSSALVGGGPAMLRLVIIPQLRPYLAAGWLLAAAMILLEGGVPLSLQLPVLATDITSRFMMGETAGSLAIRLWPMYLTVMAGFAIAWKLLFSGSHRVADSCRTDLLRPENFGVTAVLIRLVLLLTALLYLLSVGGIVWQAFAGSGSGMAFSSDWAAMLQTIVTALVVAVLAVVTATPLGSWLAGGSSRVLPALLLLPMVLPASLSGVAWAFWGVRLSAIFSWLPESGLMIVAHLARVLPVAVIVALAVSKARAGKSAEEAALLQRRAWWRRIMLQLPNLLLVGASAAIFSLRELEVALMTVPPGGETLPLRVFNLLHYGAGADVCRLSLLLLIPVIAVAYAVGRKIE